MNINEMGGVAVAELIKTSFKSLAGPATRKAGDLYRRIFEDFNPYMERCYQRNRFVRIICQGDDDIDLLDIYVQNSFTNLKGDAVKDSELTYRINEGGNYVITGRGGAGKTFFMRKLWLDIFITQVKTPVFLELRNLNDLSSLSLEAFIRASISTHLPQDTFENFCAEGRFIFILDGFDELPDADLERVQRQIIKMSESYNKCSIIVSSRPHERFQGWANFKVFESSDFTLEQTRQLCSKVPFNEEYRKLFIRKLNQQFFDSYESFLSNPLLSIMMMMTFKENMDIPKKIGIFYDAAFFTLYQRHDTVKVFNRRKNLDIQQFRRSFGAFCLLTYVRERFDFSKFDLIDFISTSSVAAGVEISPERVLDDYERNVNLIRQDGSRYYFIHRSFQEYFAAWALINIAPDRFGKFSEIIQKRFFDSVLRMSYDIDRNLVVSKYIKPNYEKAELNYWRKINEDSVWKLIGGLTAHPMPADQESDVGFKFGYGPNLNSDFIHFLLQAYSMMLPERDNDHFGRAYREITEAIFTREIIDHGPRWRSFFDVEGDIALSVLPDLKNKKINISFRGFQDITIDMTDKEREYFTARGKHLIKFLSAFVRWCKDEINSASDSQKAIDALFLGD